MGRDNYRLSKRAHELKATPLQARMAQVLLAVQGYESAREYLERVRQPRLLAEEQEKAQ